MEIRFSLVWLLALTIMPMTVAAEDIWTDRTDMPTARYVFCSGAVNGKVYAIGGDAGAGGASDIVEEYNPVTDQWTKKAKMPFAIGGASSCTANGRIYVIGGLSSQWASPSARVQVYDPVADTWSMGTNMPTARGWFSASAVNGKIYAIGGALRFDGQTLSVVEEYDPAADTWTKKADMPTARACLSTIAVNGKIYAMGGTPGGSWSQAVSSVEEYDPATDTWTAKRDMPTRRSYLCSSAVHGRIYAIGGFSANYVALSSVDQYDPTMDSWTAVTSMPTARWGLSSGVVAGKMYAIGGRTAQGSIFSIVEEYNLNPLPPDFNGDGRVDGGDVRILAESWGQSDPTCDIAPSPFGDGIVDVRDLIALADCIGADLYDPTLIAHWALDEADGITAYDSMGKHNATACGEPLWQPDGGAVGGALALDGTDEFLATDFVLDPSKGPLSVLAWVKGGAPDQAVLSQIDGEDWLCTDPMSGFLTTELRGAGRGSCALYSETVITDGDWHRIGLTWDGTNRCLHVDDSVVAEDAQTGGLDACSGAMNIGCDNDMAAGTFWGGLIDDVRIYNRAVRP
jgi:N-acetylneuraminic acid mutarotase